MGLGRGRRVGAIAGLAAALLLAVLAGVALGAVRVSPAEILGAVGRALGGRSAGFGDAVIIELRLPRVVLAALVGMCLGAAGVLYQALFRNPLADPYILGVSSGAGLGAVAALTLLPTGARFVGLPVAAFVGALATIVVVTRLATRRGRLDGTSLLLAGVAISYTLSAVTSFVLVFRRESMASVIYWMMGGLTGASWQQVAILGPLTLAGLVPPALMARELNLMLLGDERAGQLGLSVERFKLAVLAVASLLVAAAVSVSGLIGFVGLMTPHMARLVLGPDHRLLLPASVLGGGIVMVLADLVARAAMPPIELPVGIVTAALGGPFFVWLLVRRERRA